MPSPAKVVQSCRVFLCVFFFYLREQCKRATAHHLPLGASLTPPGWRYKPQCDEEFRHRVGETPCSDDLWDADSLGHKTRRGVGGGGGGCVPSFVG